MTNVTAAAFNRFREEDIEVVKSEKTRKAKAKPVMVYMMENGSEMQIKYQDGMVVNIATKGPEVSSTLRLKDGSVFQNDEAKAQMKKMNMSLASDETGFSILRQYPNKRAQPNEDVSVFKQEKKLIVKYTSYLNDTYPQTQTFPQAEKLALA